MKLIKRDHKKIDYFYEKGKDRKQKTTVELVLEILNGSLAKDSYRGIKPRGLRLVSRESFGFSMAFPPDARRPGFLGGFGFHRAKRNGAQDSDRRDRNDSSGKSGETFKGGV